MNIRIFLKAVILMFLIPPLTSFAGSFNVTPIKVFLKAAGKTENLTVKNEAERPITMQVKAFEWSQDEKGSDIYLPTDEVMYFPRIFSLNTKESRLIKVGYDKKPSKTEKTFRVFIEEVPQAEDKDAEGNVLRLALRMGIPVFIEPSGKHEPKGEIARIQLSKGTVRIDTLNSGNTHFFIKKITLTGKDASGQPLETITRQGWYVLTGKTRTESISLPPEKCPLFKEIEVELEAEKLNLKDKINVDRKMCES